MTHVQALESTMWHQWPINVQLVKQVLCPEKVLTFLLRILQA